MAQWASKGSHYHAFNVGRIGCLVISVHYENGKANTPLNYNLAWHENENYISGEGVCIPYDDTFSYSEAGLALAKQTAIEWAKHLLEEALNDVEIEIENRL
jgi:hypothetical protein